MVCSIRNPGHSGGLFFEALTSVVPDAIIKRKLVISGERERYFVRKLILAVLGIQLGWNKLPTCAPVSPLTAGVIQLA